MGAPKSTGRATADLPQRATLQPLTISSLFATFVLGDHAVPLETDTLQVAIERRRGKAEQAGSGVPRPVDSIEDLRDMGTLKTEDRMVEVAVIVAGEVLRHD